MKSIIQVAVVGSALACHALPEVVNVKVEPISPWGKAYVTFGINEDFETNDTTVAIMAHLVASNRQTHVIYEHVCKMDLLARENNHVLWDLKGSKRYFPMSELDFKVKLEAWVQLWADGPYWAECNVGATTSEDAGYSFWWGDTIGYRRNNLGKWAASDGSSDDFEFLAANVKTYFKDIAVLKAEGYIEGAGKDCLLTSEFDAASVHLGGGCRLPTNSEIVLLCECTRKWTFQNGTWGCIMKGKNEYSTKAIFLPATPTSKSIYWTSQIGYYNAGSYLDYAAGGGQAVALSFSSGSVLDHFGVAYGNGYYGTERHYPGAVRAVFDFKK